MFYLVNQGHSADPLLQSLKVFLALQFYV